MPSILQQLLVQLILILLNAYFAATEIAVISLNEKKIKSKADGGDKKAKKMLKMIEEPTQFLSTIQIGITLAGFLGSAFAADNFAGMLSSFVRQSFSISPEFAATIDTVSVVVITLILSFFTLVLGELVPKRIAMKYKEKFAEAVCGPVTALSVVLKPVIWLTTVSANGVLRLFGIDPNEKEEPVSEEDIVIMLNAGVDEGSLDQDDINYVKNIFKLDNLTAADIMTPRKQLSYIYEDASTEEIIENITENGYSRIPVCSESADEIVGILYAKDFLLNHTNESFNIKEAMFEPTYVPESMHLDVLFKEMQAKHTHLVIVVNEYGVCSGIVTMEDIFEELVGEIWDESDEEVINITEIEEKKYQVLCSTSTEDFFAFFELTPDDESKATTVNGWLIELNENIPEVGAVITYENLVMTVTDANEMMTHEITVEVTEKITDEESEEEESTSEDHPAEE